jgi:hypothetical protein
MQLLIRTTRVVPEESDDASHRTRAMLRKRRSGRSTSSVGVACRTSGAGGDEARKQVAEEEESFRRRPHRNIDVEER